MERARPRFRRRLYIAGFGTLLLIFALSLPGPLFSPPYSPALYSREGELLGARVAADGQWRFPPGPQVNGKFAAALLEYEDRRFKYHPGVDPIAVCRALLQNLRAGGIVSGGSTLTMQTIRLSRQSSRRKAGLPARRTLLEKAVEAALALRLEIALSKDEILALYAAHAPFGGNVVGLEAASWRWFGRSAEDLSWAEAATLAVLPNSPSLVHPGRNRALLREKRDALLDRLRRRGRIDEETLLLARAEALPAEPLPLPQLAPHLLSRILGEQAGGPDAPSRIDTTLDRAMQEQADRVMNRWARRFAENGVMNGACLVMDTRSGEVRAYIGNVRSPEAADVDIIVSPRSSGSILKPFLFAAMLDSGDILPASLVSDIPTRVGSYSPENITRNYLGAVPAASALARSLNIPAVRALRRYGVGRFARLLRALGASTLFRPDDEYGLPLILGGAEVTLWDLAGLYAGLARTSLLPFARETQFFPPAFYPQPPQPPPAPAGTPETGRAPGRQAVSRAEPPPGQPRPYSPGAAWLTLEALAFGTRPGEDAAWQEYAGARRIAWKTGTSFGYRDTWAVGVTPRWTIAVWIGNASGEGRPELRSAVTASPVLFELFSAFGAGEWFPRPDTELGTVEICAASGFPAGPDCEKTAEAAAPRRSPALPPCPYCRTITLNEAGDRQALAEAGSSRPLVQKKWFVLPPAEEWYYRRWNLDYRPLPPPETAESPGKPASPPLALFNPEEGSQIYVPIELDGSPGRVLFAAAHRENAARVHWHLDETYLGYTEFFHEMESRPSPGPHTLTLVDMAGNTLTRRFEVLARADEG
ncbi:MAG: penicillin-binding protein 1C [Treponema sp.]|nr:penicillin-binding protein 1C [Treponema sp.]